MEKPALSLLKKNEVNLILLDIKLPGMNGLEVLKNIKDQYEYIEVIVITMIKKIDTVVKAIKLGAYDYVTKDFNYDIVLNLVTRALEKQEDKRKLFYFQSEMKRFFKGDFVLSMNEKMKEIYSTIEKIANLRTTILITGESGTGKEVIARMIHEQSDEPAKPFVVANVAAIPQELVNFKLNLVISYISISPSEG